MLNLLYSLLRPMPGREYGGARRAYSLLSRYMQQVFMNNRENRSCARRIS
jgi:hypothetical protein